MPMIQDTTDEQRLREALDKIEKEYRGAMHDDGSAEGRAFCRGQRSAATSIVRELRAALTRQAAAGEKT